MTSFGFWPWRLEHFKFCGGLPQAKTHVIHLHQKIFALRNQLINHLFLRCFINAQMHDFRFQFLMLLSELIKFSIGLRVVHRQLVMSRHVWLCLADCLDMTRRVLIGFFRKSNSLQKFGDALFSGLLINKPFKIFFGLNAQAF